MYRQKSYIGHLKVLSLWNQRPEPDPDVGVVFSEPELFADFAADDIVTFLLYELSDFLAFQTQGEQAAVADFPVGQSFLLKRGNESWMIFLENDFSGNQKRFSVGNQVLDLILWNPVCLVIRWYMWCEDLVQYR